MQIVQFESEPALAIGLGLCLDGAAYPDDGIHGSGVGLIGSHDPGYFRSLTAFELIVKGNGECYNCGDCSKNNFRLAEELNYSCFGDHNSNTRG